MFPPTGMYYMYILSVEPNGDYIKTTHLSYLGGAMHFVGVVYFCSLLDHLVFLRWGKGDEGVQMMLLSRSSAHFCVYKGSVNKAGRSPLTLRFVVFCWLLLFGERAGVTAED